MNTAQPDRIDFDVEIGGQTGTTFAGHFFAARNRPRGILQILAHGNTYDHRYWNAGMINGVDYSYAPYMAEKGYDILALDLPGTGDSSRPPGDAVDLESVGRAMVSVIDAMMRSDGPVSGTADRVALVGHSLGTIVNVYTQARWRPADLLVATAAGYFPRRGASPMAGVRDTAMKQEYSALPPELRAAAFYHPPTTDPEVMEFDNRVLRSSLPRRLWADTIAARDDLHLSGVADVECPVYQQLGEHDPVMPGSLAGQERGCWKSSTDVEVVQVDDIGHCFNLHRNHEQGWAAIDDFLSRH